MKYLVKVNSRFYSYFDRKTGMLFTMRCGDRGVYGMGKAWYLSVTYEGAQQTIATFCVKDDGHKVYKEDYMSMLWEDRAALTHADQMIGRMLGKEE